MVEGCEVKGHEPIVAMRLNGKTPASIWITVGEPKNEHHLTWHQYIETHTNAQVSILPGERLKDLDLRWAHSMWVMITGEDHEMMDALAGRLMKEHAREVHVNLGGTLLSYHDTGEIREFPIS